MAVNGRLEAIGFIFGGALPLGYSARHRRSWVGRLRGASVPLQHPQVPIRYVATVSVYYCFEIDSLVYRWYNGSYTSRSAVLLDAEDSLGPITGVMRPVINRGMQIFLMML